MEIVGEGLRIWRGGGPHYFRVFPSEVLSERSCGDWAVSHTHGPLAITVASHPSLLRNPKGIFGSSMITSFSVQYNDGYMINRALDCTCTCSLHYVKEFKLNIGTSTPERRCHAHMNTSTLPVPAHMNTSTLTSLLLKESKKKQEISIIVRALSPLSMAYL